MKTQKDNVNRIQKPYTKTVSKYLLGLEEEEKNYYILLIIIKALFVYRYNPKKVAERQGFEPWVRKRTTVFETAPFDHSGISPLIEL